MARLSTPHFNDIATPNVGSVISCCKPGVLGDLIDGLKEIGVTKNKQKEVHNVAIEETQRIEICVKAEVEKKRLNIERELGICRFALEERQQEFQKKMAFKTQKA